MRRSQECWGFCFLNTRRVSLRTTRVSQTRNLATNESLGLLFRSWSDTQIMCLMIRVGKRETNCGNNLRLVKRHTVRLTCGSSLALRCHFTLAGPQHVPSVWQGDFGGGTFKLKSPIKDSSQLINVFQIIFLKGCGDRAGLPTGPPPERPSARRRRQPSPAGTFWATALLCFGFLFLFSRVTSCGFNAPLRVPG